MTIEMRKNLPYQWGIEPVCVSIRLTAQLPYQCDFLCEGTGLILIWEEFIYKVTLFIRVFYSQILYVAWFSQVNVTNGAVLVYTYTGKKSFNTY